MTLRIRGVLAAAALLLLSPLPNGSAAALQRTAPAVKATSPTRPASEDRHAEDALARAFESTRAANNLRPLTRIVDRPALRQLTCTAAQTANPPLGALNLEANAASTIVRLTDLNHPPPEFLAVAHFNDHGADPSHKITRYAVSVWPDAHDPSTSWVGVSLYWSRLRQTFALRFTRDYRPPDLRSLLAPACLQVH